MAVSCLTDLQHRILKADCPVEITVPFNGLELITSIGRFSLGPDEFFENSELSLDGKVITKKQLEVLLKGSIDI